jgi:hypothetical protein
LPILAAESRGGNDKGDFRKKRRDNEELEVGGSEDCLLDDEMRL